MGQWSESTKQEAMMVMEHLRRESFRSQLVFFLGALLVLSMPGFVLAHCDTLDGPVVKDARLAIQKKDVTPVLKWIRESDEKETRQSFDRTMAVRVKGADAQELADMYFFETVVRIHRAGEGVPYMGLLPAGTKVGPGVAEADKAIDSGRGDALWNLLGKEKSELARTKLNAVLEKKKNKDNSVADGRAFVAAYVDFVHYVEAALTPSSDPGTHAHDAHETRMKEAPPSQKQTGCQCGGCSLGR